MNPQGMVQTNPVNKTQGKSIHSFSTFDKSLSYRKAMLCRFGDYTPSFEMEGVPTDEIRLNSKDMIDSLSLNAPFKGQIRKIKESFAVPYQAILPLNWDKIYVQPSNGDDVPTNANCVLQSFPERFSAFFSSVLKLVHDNRLQALPESGVGFGSWFTAALRCLVLGEYVYSKGSLLNFVGYKACAQIIRESVVDDSFDAWFNEVIYAIFKHVAFIVVRVPNGESFTTRYFTGLVDGNLALSQEFESFRSLLELFRENPLASVYTVGVLYNDVSTYQLVFEDVSSTTLFDEPFEFILPELVEADLDDSTSLNVHNLNLSRLLAYQLVCAHYFTNSSLDFIYSADLYRQYIDSLTRSIYSSSSQPYFKDYFSWNGYQMKYDSLSGYRLSYLLYLAYDTDAVVNWTFAQLSKQVPSEGVFDPGGVARLAAYAAIFGFRKSLRFGDYFVGSRPRPLAPINTDISVNNNKVDVVDVTRNIQAQRFANFVMRTRSKIEDYVKGMFGHAPAPDYHNPFYLTRQEEMIFGDDVQNTAESQSVNSNSRTANFASAMNDYTFTFQNDDSHPCVYLQIISFDVKRFYTRSVERFFLHADRFDMFNPNYQYIGDQPVYGIELGYPVLSDSGRYLPDTFAYQTRDAEYKERFDVACGDWRSLPGWILTDDERSRVVTPHIDSDFIRSYNTELDQFYLSLTGFSLGTYYHFIIITNNLVSARRPMAVDPQILA